MGFIASVEALLLKVRDCTAIFKFDQASRVSCQKNYDFGRDEQAVGTFGCGHARGGVCSIFEGSLGFRQRRFEG